MKGGPEGLLFKILEFKSLRGIPFALNYFCDLISTFFSVIAQICCYSMVHSGSFSNY